MVRAKKSEWLKVVSHQLPKVNTSDLLALADAVEKELAMRRRLGMRGLVGGAS